MYHSNTKLVCYSDPHFNSKTVDTLRCGKNVDTIGRRSCNNTQRINGPNENSGQATDCKFTGEERSPCKTRHTALLFVLEYWTDLKLQYSNGKYKMAAISDPQIHKRLLMDVDQAK